MELSWIMTLQWPRLDGTMSVGTSGGTYTPEPGETRFRVIKRLFEDMCRDDGIPASANIMFLDLAPNKLNGE